MQHHHKQFILLSTSFLLILSGCTSSKNQGTLHYKEPTEFIDYVDLETEDLSSIATNKRNIPYDHNNYFYPVYLSNDNKILGIVDTDSPVNYHFAYVDVTQDTPMYTVYGTDSGMDNIVFEHMSKDYSLYTQNTHDQNFNLYVMNNTTLTPQLVLSEQYSTPAQPFMTQIDDSHIVLSYAKNIDESAIGLLDLNTMQLEELDREGSRMPVVFQDEIYYLKIDQETEDMLFMKIDKDNNKELLMRVDPYKQGYIRELITDGEKMYVVITPDVERFDWYAFDGKNFEYIFTTNPPFDIAMHKGYIQWCDGVEAHTYCDYHLYDTNTHKQVINNGWKILINETNLVQLELKKPKEDLLEIGYSDELYKEENSQMVMYDLK